MAEAPAALLADPLVSWSAMAVAAVLWGVVRRDDPDPHWWETLDRLAERLGVTARQARRAHQALIASGWAERVRYGARFRTRLVRDRLPSQGAPPARRSPAQGSSTAEGATAEVSSTARSGVTDCPPSGRSTARSGVDQLAPIEPQLKPSTSPSGAAGGISSGVLFEIDQVRRTVEAETGARIGGLTRRVDKLDGLGPALEESGLEELLAVVRHRCERVAAGDLDQRLWRRLFTGDGYNAAREAYLEDRRAAAAAATREAADVAAIAARPDTLDPGAATDLLQSAPFLRRRST